MIKIIKAKDAELKLLYENGAILTQNKLKTKSFNVDEFLDSDNRPQRDITDSLSHEKFNQILLKCKSKPFENKNGCKNGDAIQPKVKEKPKESKVESSKVSVSNVEKTIKEASPEKNSINKKRTICQVTVQSKKKINSDSLNKMMKKF